MGNKRVKDLAQRRLTVFNFLNELSSVFACFLKKHKNTVK